MRQVILLSLTASLNPTLVAATSVMVLLQGPAKLIAGYLVGALISTSHSWFDADVHISSVTEAPSLAR